ncbi:MAG: MotA/TolQ/ExbB proton channel family protein [Polyangiaceae bacterium]|nr:MotA/TolQ/ExbB proton channel family protein [Polyangiaceae bacterium]MBK8997009.1 MotA/TolQ/ExbB proton channel family protein [Myxococcales bacterium]MCE7889895.1 transporter [Sorangiineae bacterium PRO1]MCL4751189.1 MotA/TolQ/ExbB proton channel family protein [Myxococcales bacterium]
MVLAAPAAADAQLNPVKLMLGSSGVVLVVLLILIVAATGVWVIWLLKSMQLRRLMSAQHQFEREAERAAGSSDLITLALKHRDSPGGRVVMELAKRHHMPNLSSDLLMAVAKRAIASEQQRASTLMPTLSSIASATPFIGLFGTVWGIMNAFIKIGVEKSASLPVVAPAIGEALIATAFGLVAAIPATIGFNYVDKRIGDLMEELTASSEAWAEVLAADPGGPTSAVPLVKESNRPPAQPGYARG